jgi:hypothetical protein
MKGEGLERGRAGQDETGNNVRATRVSSCQMRCISSWLYWVMRWRIIWRLSWSWWAGGGGGGRPSPSGQESAGAMAMVLFQRDQVFRPIKLLALLVAREVARGGECVRDGG